MLLGLSFTAFFAISKIFILLDIVFKLGLGEKDFNFVFAFSVLFEPLCLDLLDFRRYDENDADGIFNNGIIFYIINIYIKNIKLYMKKRNTRYKKPRSIKGGISSTYDTVFRMPSWQTGENPWATLIRLEGTELYSSSIPDENVYNCLATLKFYMFVKGIKRIISLQGCGIDDGHPMHNCKGYIPEDMTQKNDNYEEDIWNGLKSMSFVHKDDSHIEFVNHKITDMSAGRLTTWLALYDYNYYNPNQPTLIHCLAGFGRTGSILLLVYLDNYYKNNFSEVSNLSKKFLGYKNGNTLYTELGLRLYDALIVDDNVYANGQECNAVINAFDKSHITRELFDTNTLTAINIFITRVNYICICLAFGYNQKEIYLYYLKYEYGVTSENMLDNPLLVKLSDIEGIANTPDNKFGITM